MTGDQLILTNLIEELAEAWCEKFTFKDIRSDPQKIDLLQRARDEVVREGILPSDTIQAFYLEVFLREQFGSGTRPNA